IGRSHPGELRSGREPRDRGWRRQALQGQPDRGTQRRRLLRLARLRCQTGGREARVELDVQGPNKWDAAEQSPVVNSVATSRPDATPLAPVDDPALPAPPAPAAAQGTEIVLVATIVKDPSLAVSQVTCDDELAGRKAVEEVIRVTGGKGSVVTINTQPG